MKIMKQNRILQFAAAMVTLGLLLAACETAGDNSFGKPCETGADCRSDFCVGGEAGTVHAPFCSDDCAGQKTGDACGNDQGRCIADFVSWCWMPCETDAQCVAINPERPVCSITSSSGVDSLFKVCIGKLQN